MVKTNVLKGKIVENGYNNMTISSKMGMSVNGFAKKVKGENKFYIEESVKLANLLNLSREEYENIFYDGLELKAK